MKISAMQEQSRSSVMGMSVCQRGYLRNHMRNL